MLVPLSTRSLNATRAAPSPLASCSRLPLRTILRSQFTLTGSQQRYAGSEPSKIAEDQQLDLARKKKDEGAIMAVQSGLFKLLLPLPNVSSTSMAKRLNPDSMAKEDNAVLFLLHPKQPLSVIASLIQNEITRKDGKAIEVSFHGAQEKVGQAKAEQSMTTPQWSQATELGDFVQEAAEDRKFVIALHEQGQAPHITPIRVPTFEQRTVYLRDRLKDVTKQMQSLLEVKTECDTMALAGAKRAAFAGFGGLLGYWGVVYWLTFKVYGWDVMEPVTYLTGLTGIIGGYMWFLYHQKEISYRSVFEMSSSKRREQLYDAKGFDRQRWEDLVKEGAELRRAIKKIARDYSQEWSMDKEIKDEKTVAEIKKKMKKQTSDSSDEEKEDEADQDATQPTAKA